jgi:hypothetical protein
MEPTPINDDLRKLWNNLLASAKEIPPSLTDLLTLIRGLCEQTTKTCKEGLTLLISLLNTLQGCGSLSCTVAKTLFKALHVSFKLGQISSEKLYSVVQSRLKHTSNTIGVNPKMLAICFTPDENKVENPFLLVDQFYTNVFENDQWELVGGDLECYYDSDDDDIYDDHTTTTRSEEDEAKYG